VHALQASLSGHAIQLHLGTRTAATCVSLDIFAPFAYVAHALVQGTLISAVESGGVRAAMAYARLCEPRSKRRVPTAQRSWCAKLASMFGP
jgi:hypothetical protein